MRSLRYPQRKKSNGDRSGLRGGHKPVETSRSPKNSRRNSIDDCDVWGLAPSCWNRQ
ncbi:hypothetical protein PGB90_008577 [Kerria lacca]